jgi:NitT/TauT family transport system ATP-binding protein
MDISLNNIRLSFGEKQVLGNLSAVFPEGKVSCIMGASGSGKTTLLRLLMGSLKPDGGEVTGVPARFSAVFQEDRLCEDFSPMLNIKLVLPRNTPRKDILAALESVGLADCAEKPVRELSGGMKRRVAIVRAVMVPGDAVFMDEPFRGLDEETLRRTAEYVRASLRGRTCVIATHNSAVPEIFEALLLRM